MECAGKSTLSKKFVEYLEACGENVVYIREPGTTKIGEELRKILAENPMNTVSRAALFSASFFETWSTVITPAKQRGDIIVSDRWYDSMMAYQMVNSDTVSQNFVRDIQKSLIDIGAEPDLTFLVDISLDIFAERLRKKKKLDVTEKLGIDFHRQVKVNYLYEFSVNERIYLVDGSKNIDYIMDRIICKYKDAKNFAS